MRTERHVNRFPPLLYGGRGGEYLSGMATALPPPEPAAWISPALALHLSEEGLSALADGVAGLLPQSLSATGLSGEYACGDGELLAWSSSDLTLRLVPGHSLLIPSPGRLDLWLDLTLYSDPASLFASGTCAGFSLNESCTLEIQPTPLVAGVGLSVGFDESSQAITIQVDDIAIETGMFGNPFHTGCLLGDAVEVLSGWGVDLLSDLLSDLLVDQEDALGDTLQTSIDDALTGFSFDPFSFDLGDGHVDVELAFSGVMVDENGLGMTLQARSSTPTAADCTTTTAPFAPHATSLPPLDGRIHGTASPYDAVVMVSSDLVDQLAYALWQSGGLCLELSDLSGVPLTTDFLTLFLPELDSLWDAQGEAARLSLQAPSPPFVSFPFEPGVLFHLEGLDLSVMGGVQGRLASLTRLGISGAAGLDLALVDGVLTPSLDLDLAADFEIDAEYAELVPLPSAQSFADALPDLAASVLDPSSLVPLFTLPEAYGIGISSLQTSPGDDEGTWLGLYAELAANPVPLEIDPIDLTGVGCDGGEVELPGCEAGCEDVGSGCDADACTGGEACEGGSACATSQARGWGRISALTCLALLLAVRRNRAPPIPSSPKSPSRGTANPLSCS